MYSTFEYINHFYSDNNNFLSVPVVFTVTKCLGNSTILATDNYDDLLTGKLTTF